ncbi:IscS subfamily cysteine desulfurase [Bacillus sp. FJAT-47783]|uniref:IscS subfamily cysteine desulfurase n=1 Tax=Bacillus sp. FJAT-47783 TaxID=2922712 RepID=UPI001FAB3C9A|nr:IscS subfamily cysteine desulfurase [Bacillus sp. FJAT-47783]
MYFDYAATTPMSKIAMEAFIEASTHAFGNANSLHDLGGKSNEWLTACRSTLANIIGGKKEGVYFTSGGTESNLLAIATLLNSAPSQKKHIVSSHLEHSSIKNHLQVLQNKGYNVTVVNNDSSGLISVQAVEESLRDDTALVTIQHSNSEIGIIQPIEEIGTMLNKRKILFHSDCVQSLGKVPIDVSKIKASAYSFSSHKLYGPKGVGAVYFDPSIQLNSIIPGTTHENGLRPGTVNVPGICAFVTAAKDYYYHRERYFNHFQQLRKYFLQEIKNEALPFEVINETSVHTLPHIIGLITHSFEGQYVMLELNRKGFAISTGTACQVGNTHPSPTLISIGVKEENLHQFIRISFGVETTKEDVQKLIQALKEVVPIEIGKG